MTGPVDAASFLFWSGAIAHPEVLADQVDHIPLDEGAVEGLAAVVEGLRGGVQIDGRPVVDLFLLNTLDRLSAAASQLKALTSGQSPDLQEARGELVKAAYLLGQVPKQDRDHAVKRLLRTRGLSLFASEQEMRGKARAALATLPPNPLDSLYWHIEELKLPTKTLNALHNYGIRFVGELVQRSEPELFNKVKNFGGRSLKKTKEALQKIGLALAMRLSEPFDIQKAEEEYRKGKRSVAHC